MSKPTYHYICPCGFRTNLAWKMAKHKKASLCGHKN
jgi:hypothetical protein